VELAAAVVVPATVDLAAFHGAQPPLGSSPRSFYSSRTPILGNDVLRSWTERIRMLGLRDVWLTSNYHDEKKACAELTDLAKNGVERLLLIKLKSYAEMDLADLLQFHSEGRNSITEAHDDRGRLGVSLLDRLALQSALEKQESSEVVNDLNPLQYAFHGYSKRILSAKGRQELVSDGLTGACAMRPVGRQVGDQVWVGEGVRLADSVRLIGPAYIGAHAIIRAGATIGPFVSIERDCVIDCGVTVEHSTILPDTYLASGISIGNAVVDGGYLEDLEGGAVVDLQSAGLGTKTRHPRYGTFAEVPADAFSRSNHDRVWAAASSPTAARWRQVQL
jgi:carbonic anhydrase/acetyltransferase-like protein (isoleucine patch superfamily)